jgi:hypothetical protein
MDLDPKPVPESVNPDRKHQYRDASPVVLRDQLNENWRQLRILSTAVTDRDKIIGDLHSSVKERDETIELLNGRLRYSKVKVALLYALVGGAAAKGAEVGILALGHFLAKVLLG